MNTPAKPTAGSEVLVQIGIGDDGQPLYAYRQTTLTVMPPQLVARPYGAWAAAGCAGLVALVVVAVIVIAIVLGLTIAAAVLALALVALTICVLVLRSMWAEHQASKTH